jgi:hypothetical protein
MTEFSRSQTETGSEERTRPNEHLFCTLPLFGVAERMCRSCSIKLIFLSEAFDACSWRIVWKSPAGEFNRRLEKPEVERNTRPAYVRTWFK